MSFFRTTLHLLRYKRLRCDHHIFYFYNIVKHKPNKETVLKYKDVRIRVGSTVTNHFKYGKGDRLNLIKVICHRDESGVYRGVQLIFGLW